jgi:RNA polymerase sigma-70 factor (ECF subfamily)
VWLEPLPDELLADADENPEARYTARESVTLAFLTALQTLPPRQRAVVILCDVLDWQAGEAADCLGMTVSAVNSALHRARATLAKRYHGEGRATVQRARDARTQNLLDRYVRAWEAADIAALVGLLKEDVIFAMPPMPVWYRGREAIRAILPMFAFTGEGPDQWRLTPTRANGTLALACYRREGDGPYRAVGVQVLTFGEAGVAESIFFLGPGLFPRLGLPLEMPATPSPPR